MKMSFEEDMKVLKTIINGYFSWHRQIRLRFQTLDICEITNNHGAIFYLKILKHVSK